MTIELFDKRPVLSLKLYLRLAEELVYSSRRSGDINNAIFEIAKLYRNCFLCSYAPNFFPISPDVSISLQFAQPT